MSGRRTPVTRRAAGRLIAGLALAGMLGSMGVSVAFAQRIWVGRGRYSRTPPKLATLADFDGSWVYCRGMYRSRYREMGGQGWSTDYPGADNNFSIRLAELTTVSVRLNADRQPNTVVVPLGDPLLFRCPMLFMEDVGTAEFNDAEVQALRDFFEKGGFLWVDDFWGTEAWDQWVSQINRILPSHRYPIVDVPIEHPIMHMLYDVKEFLQVSSIQFWYQSGGHVLERGADSTPVHYRGIQDSHGRLMVLMTHNTDVADTWEREGENREYFDLFSPAGYAIGVNVVLYALTH